MSSLLEAGLRRIVIKEAVGGRLVSEVRKKCLARRWARTTPMSNVVTTRL